MSSAAAVIGNLGTHNWNARVYNVLALASQMAATVKNRGNVIRLAYHLRNLNNHVTEFVGTVNDAMEGKRKPDPNADPVTAQTIRSSADNLEEMYRTLDYVVEAARRAGLTNNSLTAGPVRSIQQNLEAIANLADWLDLAAQPEAVNEIFERTKRERDRGELIDLTEVE
jgi:hypothetical protein